MGQWHSSDSTGRYGRKYTVAYVPILYPVTYVCYIQDEQNRHCVVYFRVTQSLAVSYMLAYSRCRFLRVRMLIICKRSHIVMVLDNVNVPCKLQISRAVPNLKFWPRTPGAADSLHLFVTPLGLKLANCRRMTVDYGLRGLKILQIQ